MDCRAPRQMTIMNGKPSQVLVATLAKNAVQKLLKKLIGSKPSSLMKALMAPNCLWNIPFQIRAVM